MEFVNADLISKGKKNPKLTLPEKVMDPFF